MKTNESKKGISLIVLIITILVMMIIAAAIILNIDDTKIINNAEKTANQNDWATAKEVRVVARTEWRLNEQKLRENHNSFRAFVESKLEDAGLGGKIAVSSTGEIVPVPSGFVASDVESEKDIAKGLVIYEGNEPVTDSNVETAQTTRNQFVWVPVPNMDEFIRNESPDTSEPYSLITAANDLTGEYAEYTNMKESVDIYGGFYMARYEAGKDGTTVVSKKSATVWNKIPWGTSMTEVGTEGAVYRARQMYNDSQSVVSTLCYGVQWDAALKFIASSGIKDEGYITTGKDRYTTSLIKAGSTDADKVNNIYDMAGNVSERTMEAMGDFGRVLRGSNYSNPNNIASFRNGVEPTYQNESSGFRVALYLK